MATYANLKNKQMDTNSTTSMELIQLNDSESVIFTYHEAKGYVGESHYWTTAHIVNLQTKSVEELTYEKVKWLYQRLKGRRERIKFWANMKAMSPKAKEEEAERSRQ